MHKAKQRLTVLFEKEREDGSRYMIGSWLGMTVFAEPGAREGAWTLSVQEPNAGHVERAKEHYQGRAIRHSERADQSEGRDRRRHIADFRLARRLAEGVETLGGRD